VAPAEVALVAVDGGGRGSFNGQFANFGNRRTAQPPLTGSFSINLNNSAFNAAPFSLNGQNIAKGSSNRIGYTCTIGGPMVIPKLLNWQRASFNVTYQGTVSRSAMAWARCRRQPSALAISRSSSRVTRRAHERSDGRRAGR